FLASSGKYNIVRDPPENLQLQRIVPKSTARLRLLVVIPMGSGLDVEREWRNLDQAIEPVRHRIDIERLDGAVTVDRLGRELSKGRWDILHFIGHGQITEAGEFEIRLNQEDGRE